MDDVAAVFDYWGEHPPTNELVAAYLGVGKKTKAKRASAAGLAAALGGGR